MNPLNGQSMMGGFVPVVECERESFYFLGFDWCNVSFFAHRRFGIAEVKQ